MLIKYSNIVPFVFYEGISKCFYCRKRFKTIFELLDHSAQHTKPDLLKVLKLVSRKHLVKANIIDLKCEICNESLNDVNHLRDHLITKHDRTFNYPSNHLMAFRIDNEDTFDCVECGKNFENFMALKRHVITHYQNVYCEICGQGYLTLSNLRAHLKRHDKSKNYVCKICHKIYTSERNLQCHIKGVHEKIKTYVCQLCDEKFWSTDQRIRHEFDVHGKDTRRKCEICNLLFRDNAVLRRHNNKFHTHKYACHFCGRSFPVAARLNEHLRTHTGERPFSCDLCQRKFSVLASMKRHINLVHKQMKVTRKKKKSVDEFGFDIGEVNLNERLARMEKLGVPVTFNKIQKKVGKSREKKDTDVKAENFENGAIF